MTFEPLGKKSLAVLALSLVLTSLLIYFPNPKMGYVLDDHYVIDRNPAVKNPSLARVLSAGLFDAAQRETDSRLNYYRPLLTASFALDNYLWKGDPFAQRMVNIVFHVLNSMLVFGLFFLLFGNLQRAGLASIFFCILPVHEWSVRYLVGRGDLLSTFFGLLTLCAVVLFIQKNARSWLWAGAGSFVCALLSKESSLLLCAYVFMTAFYATKNLRRSLVVTAYFGLIAAAYYFLRLQLLPITTGPSLDLDSFTNGMALGISYVFRLWMPEFGLQVIPYAPVISIMWIFSSLGLLMWDLKRSPARTDSLGACWLGVFWITFGLAQFLIVQRIIDRLGPVLSEHFLYFQSIGFALVLAVMIENMRARLLRKAVFVGFIFIYVSLSILSGRYWTSEESLLRHVQVLEKRPTTVAYEQLIMRYDHNEEAVLALIARAPSVSSKSVWYRRLGDIYHKRRDYPGAMDALSRAVAFNPMNTEALNQWAVCYLETGEVIKGLELLKRSIDADPGQSDAYRLSGVYFYRVGQFANAISYFKKALESDPGQAESSLHLMMAYYFVDDQNAYLEMIDRLGALDQRMVLSFVIQELYAHGFFKEVVKVIAETASIFPNDPAMTALARDARLRMESLSK